MYNTRKPSKKPEVEKAADAERFSGKYLTRQSFPSNRRFSSSERKNSFVLNDN